MYELVPVRNESTKVFVGLYPVRQLLPARTKSFCTQVSTHACSATHQAEKVKMSTFTLKLVLLPIVPTTESGCMATLVLDDVIEQTCLYCMNQSNKRTVDSTIEIICLSHIYIARATSQLWAVL